MPYIITTKRPLAGNETLDDAMENDPVAAVATLDEAREAIMSMHVHAPEDWPDLRPFRDSLTESGGTIGPLPDGTVIEVKPMGWEPDGLTDAEAVAAFNAAR